jgi:serine/threonine protein kinase
MLSLNSSDSNSSRFYAAEICLAIKWLHEQGILHRNLKLEAIMLDPEGHIKLTNVTICKTDMWYGTTTMTFCGTAEFMAPEVRRRSCV